MVSGDHLPEVLEAYAQAVSRVFYLTTGAAAGNFLFAWGMGWTTVKKGRRNGRRQIVRGLRVVAFGKDVQKLTCSFGFLYRLGAIHPIATNGTDLEELVWYSDLS